MLTPERFDVLLEHWMPRFRDKTACAAAAHEYVKTAIAPDEHRFNSWMENALAKDGLLARSELALAADPLAESHPSTYVLPAGVEAAAVAQGDIHDWTGLGDPNDHHAAHCPRCKLGTQSRLAADARARRLGKRPFPSSLASVYGMSEGELLASLEAEHERLSALERQHAEEQALRQ